MVVNESAAGFETLTIRDDAGLRWITLDRPERLNAFTVQMADELVQAFEDASADDAVRAVIVTGAGRAFCAGMDLRTDGNVFGLDERQQPSLAELDARFDDPAIVRGVRDTGGRLALAILGCSKPVIGAVNGPAVGIGATMLLSMDLRLASSDARFGFVFGRVGIAPEACSTWLLPRLVGPAQALDWFYRADVFDAEEARRGGLVSEVLSPDELLPAAERVARRWTQATSPVSVALIRQMVYRTMGQPDPMLSHKLESLAVFYTSQRDGKEGVAAFRERRAPAFTSRPSTDMPPFFPWW
jgi:enoyl-CoA hydratase/carnithine racemase